MSCGTSWKDPRSPLYIEGQLGLGEALALAIMWTPTRAHLTNWLLRLGSYKDIFFHENEVSEPVFPLRRKYCQYLLPRMKFNLKQKLEFWETDIHHGGLDSFPS